MKLFFLALALASSVFAFPLQAQAPLFTVSGTITVHQEGVIKIKLLNEAAYAAENAGRTPYEQLIPVGPKELKQKSVSFSIKDVAKDTYCIVCFLDTNGNGKMDRGIFGPKEPIAFIKKQDRLLGKPRFEDLAFLVDKPLADIAIEL